MATQKSIILGFPDDVRNMKSERTHSKKVALGIVLEALATKTPFAATEDSSGKTSLTVVGGTISPDDIILVTDGEGQASGIWKAGVGTIATAVIVETPWDHSTEGNIYKLSDIVWLKHAESWSADDTGDKSEDTWGVIGGLPMKEAKSIAYSQSVTCNIYRDLRIEEAAMLMGIDDPVAVAVSLENSKPVHLIAAHYDGRETGVAGSQMTSYSVQETVTWLTNPKNVSYDDFSKWELTGDCAYGYSRKVETTTT